MARVKIFLTWQEQNSTRTHMLHMTSASMQKPFRMAPKERRVSIAIAEMVTACRGLHRLSQQP